MEYLRNIGENNYQRGPTVGAKTSGSRVGVPNCASRIDGNRRQGTQCFTQVRALLMEVKPYVLLD